MWLRESSKEKNTSVEVYGTAQTIQCTASLKTFCFKKIALQLLKFHVSRVASSQLREPGPFPTDVTYPYRESGMMHPVCSLRWFQILLCLQCSQHSSEPLCTIQQPKCQRPARRFFPQQNTWIVLTQSDFQRMACPVAQKRCRNVYVLISTVDHREIMHQSSFTASAALPLLVGAITKSISAEKIHLTLQKKAPVTGIFCTTARSLQHEMQIRGHDIDNLRSGMYHLAYKHCCK